MAYEALCEALQHGCGVGECVAAIERGLDEQFGRNGELPAQQRARRRVATETKRGSGDDVNGRSEQEVKPGSKGRSDEELAERRRQIDERLEEINRRLAFEDNTWS